MLALLRKLVWFFDRRDRVRALALLGMMFLGAVFEALGVALILPFIAILNTPEVVTTKPWLARLYGASGLTTPQQFLAWCGIALLVTFVVKALYLALLQYLQYRFIFARFVALARRLLGAYLRTPYAFHLRRNSATLLRNVNTEVHWLFTGVLVPIGAVAIETLVFVVIVIVLFVMAPLPALVATVLLGVIAGGVYAVVRRRTKIVGKSQQYEHGEMIKWVNQGLGGVKETKVLGVESFFEDVYGRHAASYAQAMRFLRTANEVPRLAIEGMTLGSMFLVVVVLLGRGVDVRGIIPLLGLFAMAAIRLMPSLNRILAGLTNIRYFSSAVNVVYDDLRTLEAMRERPEPHLAEGARPAVQFERDIRLDDVWYQYPETPEPVLKGVSITIPRGRAVAFVGPSGAGKTTAVDLILALLEPTRGRVLIDGADVRENPQAWRSQIGYIPQPVYLSDDSVRRNVAFGVHDGRIDDERVWRALRAAQIEPFVRAMPDGLATLVGEHGVRLSGGQRQRLGIARALYHDPPVLVLDEATSALDNELEGELTKAIGTLSGQKTIILIAHRLTTVRSCDILFFMKDGRVIASDTYDGLLETNDDFRHMVRAAALSAEPVP